MRRPRQLAVGQHPQALAFHALPAALEDAGLTGVDETCEAPFVLLV
jgi:hypothetical protein